LIEVHDHDELTIALETGARVIGVNARNLATLEVDAEGARNLVREAAAAGVRVVAESGVRSRTDVEAAAAAGACAVLVGETLMRSGSPEEEVEGLTGVVCLDSQTRGDMAIT
jgi:indole-3-glycerol phosphate synthase